MGGAPGDEIAGSTREGYGKVVPVGIDFVTVRDRPELVTGMWDLPNPWATFMQQDVITEFTYDLMPVRYPELQLLAVDGDQVRASRQRGAVRLERDRR